MHTDCDHGRVVKTRALIMRSVVGSIPVLLFFAVLIVFDVFFGGE